MQQHFHYQQPLPLPSAYAVHGPPRTTSIDPKRLLWVNTAAAPPNGASSHAPPSLSIPSPFSKNTVASATPSYSPVSQASGFSDMRFSADTTTQLRSPFSPASAAQPPLKSSHGALSALAEVSEIAPKASLSHSDDNSEAILSGGGASYFLQQQQQPAMSSMGEEQVPAKKRKGGNKHAKGRKPSNFSTNCLTLQDRRAYVRNKIPSTLPRQLLTFHHNAAATVISAILLEDGRMFLAADSPRGKEFFADPEVMKKLVQLYPTRESVENRRDESLQEHRDYVRVEHALREACDTADLPVSGFSVRTVSVRGNMDESVSECYASAKIELPGTQQQQQQQSPPETMASSSFGALPLSAVRPSASRGKKRNLAGSAPDQQQQPQSLAVSPSGQQASAEARISFVAHTMANWEEARKQRLADKFLETSSWNRQSSTDVDRRAFHHSTLFSTRIAYWRPQYVEEETVTTVYAHFLQYQPLRKDAARSYAPPSIQPPRHEEIQHMPDIFLQYTTPDATRRF